MSVHSEVEVQCPSCRTKGRYVMWQTVNREVDPDAAMALGRGQLLTHHCASCGADTSVAHPVLLHAMKQHEMVHFLAGDAAAPDIGASLGLLRAVGPGRLWTVKTQHELMECARLYDAGFDLFSMLAFRERLRAQLMREGQGGITGVHFDHAEGAGEDAVVVVAVVRAGAQKPRWLNVPREVIVQNETMMVPFRDRCVAPLKWTPWNTMTALRALKLLAEEKATGG